MNTLHIIELPKKYILFMKTNTEIDVVNLNADTEVKAIKEADWILSVAEKAGNHIHWYKIINTDTGIVA